MDTNTPTSNQFPELEQITLPWLHAISDSQPAGTSAKYEPGYEVVVAEIDKLDAISGGEVNWALVVEHAGQVLHDVSKDLTIACNLAYGLHRTDGLTGCVQGFVLVSRLMENYWENLFPPLKRVRGRIGALTWLVTRVEADLESFAPTEPDRQAVIQLDMATRQLEAVIKTLLDGEGPSLRALRRVIERLTLSLPASSEQAPAPDIQSAPTAPASEPVPEAPVAQSAPTAPASEPVPEAPEVQSAPPAPDMQSAPPAPVSETVPEASSGQPAEKDDLLESVQEFLLPISEEHPSGSSAKYEPDYEWISAEVAKLDALSGGTLDWPEIAKRALSILKVNSKDLSISTYVAAAWLEIEGLQGLCRGLSLVAELTNAYWESLFPALKRIRARTGSIKWLLERVEQQLSDYVPTAKEAGAIAKLKLAAKRLDAVVKDKFDGEGPSVRPVLKTLDRVEMSLPAPVKETPPPAPIPEKVAVPAPASTVTAAPTPAPQAKPVQSQSVSADALGAAPKAFEDGQDVGKYLAKVGKTLTGTASLLRASSPATPTAYRLLRLGAWLHLSQLPDKDAQGQTKIPPPPGPLRTRLETMASNGKWQAILEETESALTQCRFWFDLNRFAAQALTGLGPDFQEARAAVETEVAAFLHRLPGAQDLLFSDGTEFADSQTKEWIVNEVLPSTEGASGSADDEATNSTVTQAQALVKDSKLSDALSLLASESTQAVNHRQRFRMRMSLAKIANSSGQLTIAHAHFQSLFEEVERRSLEEWEPALAIECIHGYLMAVRKLTKDNKALEPIESMLLGRLCVLSPAMAITLRS